MDFIASIRERSKKDPKRIVLPESEDKRIVEACDYISKKGIAKPILLKDLKNIDDFDKMVECFCGIRHEHHRDITKDKAIKLFYNNKLYAAAMMVRMGMADGFVAGASHKTSDVARAALSCINVDKRIKVMSGAFLIEIANSKYGHKGVFVFSDCGIVPFPTSEQLAGIAVSATGFAEKLLGVKPKVAMLSYSTKGSASTPNLENVRKAVDMVKGSYPKIDIDGELQVDTALDPDAAKIKDSISGSKVGGKANVLIFPNLDSGNIAYKLIQRLAKARAVGPLLLGLEKPCSDLSRACSIDDAIDAVAVTSVMAH